MTHNDCKEGDYLLVGQNHPVRFLRGTIVRVKSPQPYSEDQAICFVDYTSEYNDIRFGYIRYNRLLIPEPHQVLEAKLLGLI